MINGKASANGYAASDEAMHEIAEAQMDATSIAAMEERAALAADTAAIERRDFYPLVEDSLRARFERKTFDEMQQASGISTRINILVDALDKLDVAVWPSSRTWVQRLDDSGAWVDDEDQRWRAYIDAMHVDAHMARASWRSWVHPGIYLYPHVVEDERAGVRRLATRVMAPDCFFVEPCGDGTTWDAVSLLGHRMDPGGQLVQTRKRIDRETISYWKRRQGDTRWTLEKVEENQYRVVPGGFIQMDRDTLWSGHYGMPLCEATVQANVAQSIATLNSNGQIKMLGGVFADMQKRQRLVHGGILDHGGAGSAGVTMHDFQTDVAGFRASFIEAERRMAAIMLGLPADEFESTTVPPSGESLKLRYMGRQHRAQARRPALKAAMLDWLSTGLAVLSVEAQRTDEDPIVGFEDASKIPPFKDNVAWPLQPFRFRCDVTDLAYPETQAERQARLDFDTAHGMTTWDHAYAQENPDAVDPAVERQRNMAANAAGAAMAARRVSPIAALAQRGMPPASTGNTQHHGMKP